MLTKIASSTISQFRFPFHLSPHLPLPPCLLLANSKCIKKVEMRKDQRRPFPSSAVGGAVIAGFSSLLSANGIRWTEQGKRGGGSRWIGNCRPARSCAGGERGKGRTKGFMEHASRYAARVTDKTVLHERSRIECSKITGMICGWLTHCIKPPACRGGEM